MLCETAYNPWGKNSRIDGSRNIWTDWHVLWPLRLSLRLTVLQAFSQCVEEDAP